MIRTISNEYLTAGISDTGAELQSLVEKKTGIQIIWQKDPEWWVRQAPVLFPNVGHCYHDQYRLNGHVYKALQHGFARDMEFACIDQSENKVVHELCDNEQTRSLFPFHWKFRITHLLDGNNLTVQWEIVNTGTETMYFTIGAHTGYRLPMIDSTPKEDYELVFNKCDEIEYYLTDLETGTVVTDKSYILALKEGRIPVTEDLFEKDVLIIDGTQVDFVGIAEKGKKPKVMISCKGFPSFGIWSKPGAPFICLEPWAGRADDFGFEEDISKKKDINRVEPQSIFKKEFTIHIE